MRASFNSRSARRYAAPYVPYEKLKSQEVATPAGAGPLVKGRIVALDLSNCGLRVLSLRLPALFGAVLTELYLQKNELKELPGAVVVRLPLLQILDVSYNSIKVLPLELGRLQDLRDLNISCNQITDLPLAIFGRLYRLERLVVDGNPLSGIPLAFLQGGAQGFFRFACDNLTYPAQAVERTLELGMPEAAQDTLMRDGNHAKVSTLCYNVLAESYATGERHPYCPSWALSWNYRKLRILSQIVYLNADIVCLQEVEALQHRDFFVPSLGAAGYDGIFQPKSRAHTMDDMSRVDGCAIFWKRSVLALVEQHVIEFQSMASQRMEEFGGEGLNRLILKDNIALVALLEFWATPSGRASKIMVANTHIHWNPEFSDVKLVQTQLFLEKLSELRTSYSQRAASLVPLIIAGDFNSTPDSGVYALLTSGRLTPNHPELRNHSYGRYSERGMAHDLGLTACYGDKGLTYTNYTHDFKGVLDYVFVTRDSIAVAAVLLPLPEAQLSEHCPAIPSPHAPSDHVLLYVQLIVKLGF